MAKKNTERVNLSLSRGEFNYIKRIIINLPRNRTLDDLVLTMMDAQNEYLKRVAKNVRDKNPRPRIPKREKVPVEYYGELPKEGNEDIRSSN